MSTVLNPEHVELDDTIVVLPLAEIELRLTVGLRGGWGGVGVWLRREGLRARHGAKGGSQDCGRSYGATGAACV